MRVVAVILGLWLLVPAIHSTVAPADDLESSRKEFGAAMQKGGSPERC